MVPQGGRRRSCSRCRFMLIWIIHHFHGAFFLLVLAVNKSSCYSKSLTFLALAFSTTCHPYSLCCFFPHIHFLSDVIFWFVFQSHHSLSYPLMSVYFLQCIFHSAVFSFSLASIYFNNIFSSFSASDLFFCDLFAFNLSSRLSLSMLLVFSVEGNTKYNFLFVAVVTYSIKATFNLENSMHTSIGLSINDW